MGRTKQTKRKSKNKQKNPNNQQQTTQNDQNQGTGRGKGGKGLRLRTRKSIQKNYKEEKKINGLSVEEQLASVDVDDVLLENKKHDEK